MKNDTSANIYRLFAIFATVLASAFLLFDWIEAPIFGDTRYSIFEMTDLLDDITKYIPISWLKYTSELFKTLVVIALIDNAIYVLCATLFHKKINYSPSFWPIYLTAFLLILAMCIICFDYICPTFNCLFTIVFAIAATCCYHKFNELSKEEDNLEDDLEDYYACPNCGGDVLETTNFCPNCGFDVRVYTPEDQAYQADDYIACPNCGGIILRESKFCQFCGMDCRNIGQDQTPIPPHYRNVQNPQAQIYNPPAPTYEPTPAPAQAPAYDIPSSTAHPPTPTYETSQTHTCPSCGSSNPIGSSFCDRCGAKL